ncbi:MAG: NUDIX hydrolase [Polyangiaceae bacterium]|nr:NUDIX hydrolase [Polyangiaceae bacterium]
MNNRGAGGATEPTVVDRGFQLAYMGAYQMMRAYWRLRRPTTHGSLVAVWNAGEVLLVRNSYVSYYSLPGGYVRPGETGRDAALRELLEEVGISAKSSDLVPLREETHDWEGKHDHVHIFSLTVGARPDVKVDHREVVEASWYSRERALRLELFPPLRRALENA